MRVTRLELYRVRDQQSTDLLAVVEAGQVALEGEVRQKVKAEEGQGVEQLFEERWEWFLEAH